MLWLLAQPVGESLAADLFDFFHGYASMLNGCRVLLAIESSCDETAAAVIDENRIVRSSIVASQAELHARFGGVVPEIASRAHLERLLPVLEEAVQEAGVQLDELDAIAVTTHPGLVGSLLVGLTAAKTLAWVLDKPLVTINHVEAHLYACRMSAQRDVFPAIGLVVSGGHTSLYACHNATKYEQIGGTIDDAAGEAFDKVASILGLGYPGGPAISSAAAGGDPKAIRLPRPMLNKPDYRFSFSGLKTAVRYAALGVPGKEPAEPLTKQRISDLAASFEAAVVDVLVGKSIRAVQQYGWPRLLVGGGVAANSTLRTSLEEACGESDIELVIAPFEMCTDNAAMAGLAWELVENGQFADLDVDVTPGLIRG